MMGVFFKYDNKILAYLLEDTFETNSKCVEQIKLLSDSCSPANAIFQDQNLMSGLKTKFSPWHPNYFVHLPNPSKKEMKTTKCNINLVNFLFLFFFYFYSKHGKWKMKIYYFVPVFDAVRS